MNLKNRLADTTSPYLLQHADNPVHWQPWDEQALAAARQINRPILLSVGYSACHWCHVMAHECFEDPEVAEIMNAEFINIKVDREERPDIDQIYMAALAATGEQGGWPLTMFLTPDAKPFWGGTYFPKHPRYGRPGFMQILANIAEAWKEKGREVENGATALHNHVKKHLAADDGAELAPDPEPMLQMAQRIQKLMDPKFGGMSGAPKFPNFPYMQCLWLAALETGDANYAESVTDSLEKMLQGGIYDHIGGGLCRYSTDEQWLVPHFEKMLYDNAQLIRLLVQAHAATGKKQFRNRIEDVVGWFRREMLLPNGGLASSYDADSEGSEGKYYLWQKSQIEQVLDERTERFFEYFRLQSPPQWEGDPILTRKPDSDGAGDFISGCLKDLRIKREKRVRPERDDKLLVDWNGMAIRAIADAARHFDQPAWGKLAEDIFDAVEGLADPTGRLPHSANSNKARFPALASDYASMINAAGSLFELTGEKAILNTALRWAEILDEEHGDQNGSHFLTARSAQDVPMRIRGDTDEAIPSATAQIIEALSRLSAALTDPDLQERAYRCAAQGLARAVKQGHGQAGIFTSAYLASKHGKLITVDSSDDRFARVARQYFDPRRLDIAVRTGDANEALLPGGSQTLDTSRPSAWLCNDQTCLPPIYDPHKLETELQKKLVFYKPMKKTG